MTLAVWILCSWIPASAETQLPERAEGPEAGAFPAEVSKEIDELVEHHILQRELPGAVVLVGCRDRVVFSKAYGNRSVEPVVEVMTVDTVFDLASLTKVLATAPAVMLLAERGKVKLEDPVSRYLPAFGQQGKGKVTVQQLLVHYSGLPADLRLSRRRKTSPKSLLTRIYQSRLRSRPGEQFNYSDLGFIVLGKLVEKISGKALDRFASEHLFNPLQMSRTRFLPDIAEIAAIAPTERRRDGRMMRGAVHDPLASKLGGVAGDAGLFSTAQDLSRFCQMLLNGGSLDGVRIFRPETIARMTSAQSPEGKPNVRGLGWDIQSTYSSVKGGFFSNTSYGHTGFTGTSIWIDPQTQSYLILLTNRLHPEGKGTVKELRTELANVVGKALQPQAAETNGPDVP